MKPILISVLIVLCINVFSQTGDNSVNNSKDTIVYLGGLKVGAVQVNVSSVFITYALPIRPDSTIKVERKQLEKILYKSGRIEIFNKPVVQMIDDNQWEAVTITKDQSQVEGMYKHGNISAKSSPNSRSKKAAQQNTYIKLQKKAAAVGGTVILITNEESFGGYGDIPGCFIEGIAYGKEPLEKGTNVAEDKSKK
jgi:hypothetical protein